MTRITDEILLDFKDVLIRPKRSALKTRSEVELKRTFQFKHSGRRYQGFPVIASNMDGVGTFAMAHELAIHEMSTALRKGYSEEDYAAFFITESPEDVWFTIGISERDLTLLDRLMSLEEHDLTQVCIDVANGYTEQFVRTIQRVRENTQLLRSWREMLLPVT